MVVAKEKFDLNLLTQQEKRTVGYVRKNEENEGRTKILPREVGVGPPELSDSHSGQYIAPQGNGSTLQIK